jgi:hypothetical protein
MKPDYSKTLTTKITITTKDVSVRVNVPLTKEQRTNKDPLCTWLRQNTKPAIWFTVFIVLTKENNRIHVYDFYNYASIHRLHDASGYSTRHWKGQGAVMLSVALYHLYRNSEMTLTQFRKLVITLEASGSLQSNKQFNISRLVHYYQKTFGFHALTQRQRSSTYPDLCEADANFVPMVTHVGFILDRYPDLFKSTI